MNTYIKCHKCGQVFATTGFYGKRVGQRCNTDTSVDVRKGSGGFVKCHAVLKHTFQATNFKAAKLN